MPRAQSAKKSTPGGKSRRNKGFQADEGSGKSTAARNFSAVLEWCSFLLAVRGLATATVERYRFLVKRALADIDLPLERIGRPELEAHVKRLYLTGAGSSARQGAIVSLRGFFEWAFANRLVEANPAQHLRGPAVYRREAPYLTVGEVLKLIWGDSPGQLPRAPLKARNTAIFAVIYSAGLRASEVGPLELDDLRWYERERVYSLRIVHGKGAAEDKAVILDRTVSRLVGAYLALRPGGSTWLFPSERGKPLSRAAIRKIFLQRVAEVGIEKRGRRLSPHILRHSIATHLLNELVDIRKVQLHLRHASIRTTEKYLHSDSAQMMRAIVRKSPLDRASRGRKPRLPFLQQIAAELEALSPESAKERF